MTKTYTFGAKSNSEGKIVLYCTLRLNRKKSEFSTGIYVFKEDWNPQFKRCITDEDANKKLNAFEYSIEEIIANLQLENKHVTTKLVSQIYRGSILSRYTIKEFVHHYLYDSGRVQILAKGYFAKFVTLGNHLDSFTKMKFKTDAFDIRSVDFKFISDFDIFLKAMNSKLYKRPLSLVYIYKMHGMFRTLLIQANKEGIIREKPYENFPIRKVKTEIKYLSSAELNRIRDLDLEERESLDRIRDVFLFSVYTGLRFNDARTISMKDIDYVKGKPTFLVTYQEKTNDKVEIPILEPTKGIIEKYNEDPIRIKTGRIIPSFSNTKINAYLKVIGDLADIKLKLTHHVARHTCATTVLLENNVPLDEVSKWLGHADIRSTRVYAQITKKKLSDTADRLNKLLK